MGRKLRGFLIQNAVLSLCFLLTCHLLRIFAVFSVVISISGSVKYSDATHLPFSGPEKETETDQKKRERERDSKRGEGGGRERS